MEDNIKNTMGVEKKRLFQGASLVFLILSLFLIVQVISSIKEYRYIGSGIVPQNIISVSGEGEVFAVPDVATFSFSVSQDSKTVKEAQDQVTKRANVAIETLKKDFSIDEKDIKTVDYSVYPKYEYTSAPCSQYSCPPGKQNLVGYTVSQTISVKVRAVAEAGKILGAMGEVGVTNISGLSFAIDDEDSLKREARQMAISDAQEKAKELTKDLGVKIVRIVGFSESGNYPIYYTKLGVAEAGGRGGDAMSAPSPEIPTGENKIVSNVNIVYEIR